ncbi:MAG: hypothetical protein RL274_208 [Pseudomonadota bacterium]|jgi:hypothetical protein
MGRLVVCLVMLALLPSAAFTAPSLAGTWFGHGQPDDNGAMYLDRMLPNGEFRVHHRTCIKGKAFDQAAAGRWSQSAGGFTITIQTVNGEENPRTDAYRIVSIDAQKQHYVYLRTNFAYHARRVAGDFKMPACDLIS